MIGQKIKFIDFCRTLKKFSFKYQFIVSIIVNILIF